MKLRELKGRLFLPCPHKYNASVPFIQDFLALHYCHFCNFFVKTYCKFSNKFYQKKIKKGVLIKSSVPFGWIRYTKFKPTLC